MNPVRNIALFFLLISSGCSGLMLGPMENATPAPKSGRVVAVAVIEDSYKRTKDCPQADSKFWAELRKKPGITAAELIDSGNKRAARFKVQSDREGIPTLVVYDAPKDATRGQVRYSGKLPLKTSEISSIVTKAQGN